MENPSEEPTWLAQDTFPLDVYPPAVQHFIKETATSVCVHPDMLASAALPVFGALIGRSRVIQAKADWHEHASLFGAILAEPGSRKSPALKKLTGPLRIIEDNLDYQYAVEQEWWAEQPQKDRGLPPEPKRLILGDTTLEALSDRLRAHPRGVLVERDELIGWLAGQGQYKSGRGDDRQKWLELWAGSTLRVDRVQRGSFVVRHPHVCLLGTIQPEKLTHIVGSQGNDGLLDRFLLSAPPNVDIRYDTPPVRRVVADAYEELCQGLYALKAGDVPEQPQPHTLQLDTGGHAVAKAEFELHHSELRQMQEQRSPLTGVWAKADAHIFRVALIIAEVWHVAEEAPEVIDEQAMMRAFKVVDYYKNQAGHILGAGGILEPKEYERVGPAHEQRLIDWITEQDRQITLRDAMRQGPLRRQSRKDAMAIVEAAEARGQLVVKDGPYRSVYLELPRDTPEVDITAADIARWDAEKEEG